MYSLITPIHTTFLHQIWLGVPFLDIYVHLLHKRRCMSDSQPKSVTSRYRLGMAWHSYHTKSSQVLTYHLVYQSSSAVEVYTKTWPTRTMRRPWTK